jgi:hypothetical protein
MDGLRALDGTDHVLPVEHPLGTVDHLADVVEAGLVREHLAERDVLLPRLTELRPVLGHPRVIVEQFAIDHDVDER